MQFVRIRSYQDGTFTGCEHLYMGNDQVPALERFRAEYPEHEKCVLIAENYDSEKEENKAHFAACLRCECVH